NGDGSIVEAFLLDDDECKLFWGDLYEVHFNYSTYCLPMTWHMFLKNTVAE
ncbi:hypothetical protein WUBG_12926, partial [Wuchereria bancrofti]